MPDLIPDADWDWARRRIGSMPAGRMEPADTAQLLASHRAQAERIAELEAEVEGGLQDHVSESRRLWRTINALRKGQDA
jgi:hypothetical protein